MLGLKDKVSNQLSRLFADSPNTPSPSSLDDSQARPVSGGGKSVTSYFSFTVPSLNFSWSGSNSQKEDSKSIQSVPIRWSDKDLWQQDEYPVKYHECNMVDEDETVQKQCEVDKGGTAICVDKQTVKCDDGAPRRSSSDSDVFEEASDHQTPRTPLSNLLDESAFISSELFEFLESSIPNIVKGCQWMLLYSTLKHGISLRTLIRMSAGISGPCLLVAGDRQGVVFGGLLDCPLKPTAKRKYQGTIQSFVFTTIYGEPRLFRPTGANRYYFLCMNDLLAFGGGGNFALRLDGDLLNGTSGPCQTFGNLCLAHSPEFELKNVELWGFTHASKYRS